MSKVRFVLVDKADDFKLSRELTDQYSATHDNIRFDYVSNNTSSLAQVYNVFLAEEETREYDYLVLMHSDVSFNLDTFLANLEKVGPKYDILGLCGCAKISIGQSPLNWWCGSNPYPQDRWGCVTHGELNNQTSFFSQHHPDVLDHEVACIDGLCIIFTRKAIESGLKFDENLGKFDFYDTDISFQAVISMKLKLGVMVQKDLQHYSVGKSILSREFLETELKFRQKWKFPIPENSPIVTKVLGNAK